MTYDQAVRRLKSAVRYDPKDGSSRGLIPAHILEIHKNKCEATIQTAGTPKNKHIKRVPLNSLRCWKARDAEAGIVDPPDTVSLAVVLAAEGAANHMQNKRTDHLDQVVEEMQIMGANRTLCDIVTDRKVADETPTPPQPEDPTHCDWCNTSGHNPGSLDENKACPECRAILFAPETKKEEAVVATSDVPAKIPEVDASQADKQSMARPSQSDYWMIIDMKNHQCFDPQRRCFVPATIAGGYLGSTMAHRACGQLYRHTKNAFLFVATRPQVEQLLTAAPPATLSAAESVEEDHSTFEGVLRSVKHANERVAATKLAYEKAVEESKWVAGIANNYREQMEEQLKQLGV